MPKKMTAIEYVQRVIYIHLTHEEQMQFEGLFQQAKAMEKEQIEHAFYFGTELDSSNVKSPYKEAEQYYTSTFKS